MNTDPLQTQAASWRRALSERLKAAALGNTVWLSGSSVVNGFLGAVTSALFARALGVSEFGVVTLVFSIANALSDLADLGLATSMVRFGAQSLSSGDQDKLRKVLSIVLRAKIVIAGLLILLSVVLLNPIVSLVFSHTTDRIASYFLLSLIVVALNIATGYFYGIFQCFRQFKTYSILLSSRSLLKLLLLIGCIGVLTSLNVTLAIWIEIAAALAFVAAAILVSPARSVSLRLWDTDLSKQIFSFNKWMALAYIINLLGGRLDVFFVGGLADSRALGMYGAASKIAALIMAIAGTYLTVLLAEMSGSLDFPSLSSKARSSLLIIGFMVGGIALIAVAADPLVRIVFGATYTEAATLLRIMSAGLILTIAGYPLNGMLFTLNKSFVFPLTSGMSVMTLCVGNAYLVPSMGATGAAIAFALSGAATFLTLSISSLVVLGKRRAFIAFVRRSHE